MLTVSTTGMKLYIYWFIFIGLSVLVLNRSTWGRRPTQGLLAVTCKLLVVACGI